MIHTHTHIIFTHKKDVMHIHNGSEVKFVFVGLIIFVEIIFEPVKIFSLN
jgi:hypothetical protein